MQSSNFIKKVSEIVDKLDNDSLKKFISDLSEERNFFESIFDSMIEAVVVIDENRLIKFINKPAIILFGLSPNASLVGNNFFSAIKHNKVKEYLLKLLELNKSIISEELLIGYPIVKAYEVSIHPHVESNQVKGNIIMFLDITLIKEEQQRLKRAESLASLTTLAAGIAHEVKNPLSSVDLNIQILDRLSQELPKHLKSDFKEIVGILSQEVDRLNSIIKDFLYAIRPMKLKDESVDLVELFKNLFLLLRYEFEEHNMSVVLNKTEQDVIIEGDSKYLTQAFLNIIKNSIEAISSDGEIIVDLIKVDENVQISIRDNGKGIGKEDLSKIFEPYYTTKDFGTGLGLTIVHKIINEHGGKIKVESIKDVGTTFIIKLPIQNRKQRLLIYTENGDAEE